MSFFEDEPPSAQPTRVRRPASAPDETVVVRRLVGIGAGVLVLILLILGVRGCLGARKDRAIKSYVNDVNELVQESNGTDQQFFDLIGKPGKGTALDLQNQINTYRAGGEQLVERADKLDHPSDLDKAQRWLLAALQFRADALAGVAKEVPAAFAERGRQAAFNRIAGLMQDFLTSDVIYSQRFTPEVLRVVDKRGLSNEVKVNESRSLPELEWLDPATIGTRLGSAKGGKAATPGSHGTGLVGVTAQPSGTQLDETGATSIPVSPKVSFEIQVQDQGDNDESDVTVTVKLSGPSPVNLEKTIPTISAGDTVTVTIPLGTTPSKGPATLSIAVQPVPGEQVTDNNKATYDLNFEG